MVDERTQMEAATHNFAGNLRMIRAYHRLTLEQVAHRAALHPDTVGDYERGRGNPRVRTIARLAYALNVRPYTLLSEIRLPDLEADDHDS